jgi:hypothetical protein
MPRDEGWAMRAPGEMKVHGPEFAGNLLDVASGPL